VSDFIELKQKHAAVTLAETQSYDRAAQRLGLSVSELETQIESLESKLCLFIFQRNNDGALLTEDGRYLIELFREALSRHEGM
jgi:DNA-binding transcriptional LysR family regulator